MYSGGLITRRPDGVGIGERLPEQPISRKSRVEIKSSEFQNGGTLQVPTTPQRSVGGTAARSLQHDPSTYPDRIIVRRDAGDATITEEFTENFIAHCNGEGNWSREDWIGIFETLIESNCDILTDRRFRETLDRDQNLLANQIVREANENIAYDKVDFEIDGMSDDEFWSRIDASGYSDIIESNAAHAICQMLDKTGVLSEPEEAMA